MREKIEESECKACLYQDDDLWRDNGCPSHTCGDIVATLDKPKDGGIISTHFDDELTGVL